MSSPRRGDHAPAALALLAAVLLGSACALPERPAMRASFDEGRWVRWRVVDDPDAVCRQVARAGREQVWNIYGCVTWSREERRCDIWTGPLEPDNNAALGRTLEALGHELVHCFVGQWHS